MSATKPRRRYGTRPLDAQLLQLPGQLDHLQDRSRRTASAIVRVARQLIRKRPFDELSVNEIAAKAGTSVGGFYARFKSKDALLEVMLVAVMLESGAAFDKLMDQVKGKCAADVVRGWATTMVGVYRTNRTEIRQVLQHWPKGPLPGGRLERESALLRDHARGTLRTELLARADEIDHKDPKTAVSVALMMGTVSLREAVIGDALPGYGARLGDDELAHEISLCMIKYLGLEKK